MLISEWEIEEKECCSYSFWDEKEYYIDRKIYM